MSQEFRRVTSEDVNEQLRLVVEECLSEIIAARAVGYLLH